MRIIQFVDDKGEQRTGQVVGGKIRMLDAYSSVYDLAQAALTEQTDMPTLINVDSGSVFEDYDAIIDEKRILAPLTHPDPGRFWVTGTGLTHLGAAQARDQLHAQPGAAEQTDSMKMFRLGVEGGKPSGPSPGVQPEWFYKGNGYSVAAPEADLELPSFALDGGDEVEVCGLYILSPQGEPFRLGFALGNEYSDHVLEKENYLYLAHSKLRNCSFGPELLLADLPHDVRGYSRIHRDGKVLWEEPFLSGEANMSHSLANLEHHHFKYPLFRRPGDVHCHFFGTATVSFAKGIRPKHGDLFDMGSGIFGRPLRNRLKQTTSPGNYLNLRTLYERKT